MSQTTSSVSISTPSEREIVMIREFSAPAVHVFDAWTKCEHLKRWWGPSTWSLPECEIDLRPGGRWRYLMRSNETDEEMGMYGEYIEVQRPTRLVLTENFDPPWFEDMGRTGTNTMIFAERDGKTTLTTTSLYETKEDRDRVMQSGFDDGLDEIFARLDELLEAMQ